ncbi:DUF6746 family protein [Denitrificimonas caeni]|uniref:DUF6746 family protein n=1 Tax=Denitrificimonas caeni TaxID=521720 RepID=UPI001965D0DC|nr:DUF6746 family protein [Denitrificimonas caeni]
MKNIFKGAVFAVSLVVAGSAIADESTAHFKGLAAPDLQTAVANFSEYNKRLEDVLSGELTDMDLVKVHELTYTLENALEKINVDLEELANTLEKVHVASETFNRDALKEAAPAYLNTARIIVK